MKNKTAHTDKELIKAYVNGESKALVILVKKWHQPFCKIAFSYVKNSAIAKDIAQESWVVIVDKLDTLEDVDKFKSWAIQIVKRKALDYLRKKQRQTKHLTFYKEDVDFEENLEESTNEKKEKLRIAIKKLTLAHQQVIRLFYVEERSLTEISELLNISVGTVKSRLFHAREKLKNTIK